ncbi:MAG: hypothetical protein RR376_21625, partial [Janthinobacterium sp.]
MPASGDVATPAAAPAQGRQRPPVSQQRQPPRAEQLQQRQQQQQRAPRPPREGQAPRNEAAGRESKESREARDAARAAREAEKAFRNPLPPITYPEDLPVSGRREEIAKALTENQ